MKSDKKNVKEPLKPISRPLEEGQISIVSGGKEMRKGGEM
jgi:hypothetical protein